MTVAIIGAEGEVTYTLGMNKYVTVSGTIIDIIALSDHQNFLVLSRTNDELLVGLDSIYSISIKKRKIKKSKPDKPDFRAEVM